MSEESSSLWFLEELNRNEDPSRWIPDLFEKKSKVEDSSISSMRSLTSIGTLARTVSNLLKEPDLPGLQDIFTEPSHTEEKIHFKPLSLFTKKIGQKSSRPF